MRMTARWVVMRDGMEVGLGGEWAAATCSVRRVRQTTGGDQ